jgi:hypothetical protein
MIGFSHESFRILLMDSMVLEAVDVEEFSRHFDDSSVLLYTVYGPAKAPLVPKYAHHTARTHSQ